MKRSDYIEPSERTQTKPREYEVSRGKVAVVITGFLLSLVFMAVVAILIPFGVASEMNTMRTTHDRILTHVRMNSTWPTSWADLGVTDTDEDYESLTTQIEVDWTVSLDDVGAMISDRGIQEILTDGSPRTDSWPGLELVQYTGDLADRSSEEAAHNRSFIRELTVVMVSQNLLGRSTVRDAPASE